MLDQDIYFIHYQSKLNSGYITSTTNQNGFQAIYDDVVMPEKNKTIVVGTARI